MKYIVILGDGMADAATPFFLDGLTPLQAAEKPAMDWLAEHGCNGMLKTVPEGYAPGSEIANMAVMGYDVPSVFEGRGSLEAASMGVSIEDDEIAMRCNLITIEDGKIKNHSAGHISSEEGKVIMEFLQEKLGGTDAGFFPGVSYRHLLKLKGGSKAIRTVPPHDVLGTPYSEVMVKATGPEGEKTAGRLNELIMASMELLRDHPVNIARLKAGKDPASCIWPWSAGYRPKMQPLSKMYPEIKSGSVISAVDLIKGIGLYAGLEVINVEGATGLYDTNYEGKAAAAIKELKRKDFVYLHIEASDEAGHEGDALLKKKTIEDLDSRVVRPILDEIASWDEPVSVALLPDHPTPCSIRTHTADPVPFCIWRTGMEGDRVRQFDEYSAREGSCGLLENEQFMNLFIQNKRT